MQPIEKNVRLKSAALASARKLVQEGLGWLPGFPRTAKAGTVTWVTVPRDQRQGVQLFQLDRDHLHRATYACTRLLQRFPRALPRLVGDVECWKRGTTKILDVLKATIHRGRALPVSLVDQEDAFELETRELARKLLLDHPGLRPPVSVLSWTTIQVPDDFRDGVRWFAKYADPLSTLVDHLDSKDRFVAPLVLWELARRVGPHRIDVLVALLGDSCCHRYPTSANSLASKFAHIDDVLRKMRKKVSKDALIDALIELLSNASSQEDQAGRWLRQFADWLLLQDNATARRALEALALLIPPRVFENWRKWWLRLDGCWEEIGLCAHNYDSAQFDRDAACAVIRRFVNSRPMSLDVRSLVATIQDTSAPSQLLFYAALLPVVKALPLVEFDVYARPAFWYHWVRIGHEHPDKIVSFLRHFRHYQKSLSESKNLYAPWRETLDSGGFQMESPSVNLLEMRGGGTAWERALKVLSLCVDAQEQAISPSAVEWALALARYSISPDAAFERCSAISSQGLGTSEPRDEWLMLADRLAQNAEDFAALYAKINSFGGLSEMECKLLVTLDDCLQARGWKGLLRAGIYRHQLRHHLIPLSKLLNFSSLMSKAIRPPLAPRMPRVPAWAAAFPPPVQKALAVLNALTPDAQSVARGALRPQFVDPERIATEIQSIEKLISARPHNKGLRTRLQNLQIRQSKPAVATPTQVRKTVERIERLIHESVLGVWRESIKAEVRECLPRLLRVEGDVSVLLEERHLAALTAATELTGNVRSIALELYRRRCGPAPWDMREHPSNVSFVQRMTERGLNMGPWLAHEPAQIRTGSNGTEIAVGFEDDPLEIFLMGAYFGTCLSPRGDNFFSVFANAADVNKKVLFARNRSGHVVSRCLLALSDTGGILTFYPYSYDSRLCFKDVVRETAIRLAASMKTLVVDRGVVSNLVADEWYDDGSADLCGRFPCLEEGSNFRNALLSAPLTEIRQLVAVAFAPRAIDSLTLSMLVELPEFALRPELIQPFRHELELAEGLFIDQWIRVIKFALSANERSLARKLAHRHLVPASIRQYQRERWIPFKWLDVIGAIDPSTAIRLIRKTRPQGVRRDELDDEDRKQVLAKALRALGRKRKADALQPKQER